MLQVEVRVSNKIGQLFLIGEIEGNKLPDKLLYVYYIIKNL